MRKQLLVAALSLITSWAFGGIETLSYTLPADYTKAKIVPSDVDGYMVVDGPEGLYFPYEPAGAPMLPETSIQLKAPKNGKLLEVTYEANWKTIATDVSLLPIQEPYLQTMPKPPFVEPNVAQYAATWPAKQIEAFGIQMAAGQGLLPIKVIPFRHTAGTIEAATSFTVKATFLVPESMMAVENPEYVKTDSNQPDYIMIAPNRYHDKWIEYIEGRQSDHPELIYKLVNLKDILAEFPVNTTDSTKGYYARNDAERLHAYIRREAKKGTHYFVLAGAFYGANIFDYNAGTYKVLSLYDPDWGTTTINSENGIPGVYTQPRTAGNDWVVTEHSMPIPTDTFYACTDIPEGSKYPWDAGGYNRTTGGYDVNPEGNGLYLDEPDTHIDLMPDVVVTRISFKMNSKYWPTKPHYADLVKAYLAKVRKVESPTFDGRRKFVGVTEQLGGFGSYANIPNDMRRETEYYTGSYNLYDVHRSSKWADTEPWITRLMRDRFTKERPSVYAEFTSKGNWPLGTTSTQEGLMSYRNKNWECMIITSHGVQSGITLVGNDVSSVMTGYIKVFTAIEPCLTGYPDWDNPNVAGNTVDASHGEILIENWQGGAAFSLASAREGWYSNPNRNIDNGDGFQSRLQNLWTIGYFDLGMMPGDAALYMLRNYDSRLGNPSSARWSWTCPMLYGDPVIANYQLEDYVWNGETSGNINWNLSDNGLWTTNGVPTVYNHAKNASFTMIDSSTVNVADPVAALKMSVNQPSDATMTLEGEGRLRVSRELSLSGGNFVTKIGGGVGHDGLKFTEEKGNVELRGTEKFYLAKLTNVGSVTLAGANALLDFRRDGSVDWLNFDTLVLAGSDRTAHVNNILRSDVEGALTKYLPLSISNMGVRLETFNAFKNAQLDSLDGDPLISLNNADLTIGVGPNFGLAENRSFESIFGKMAMNNSSLFIDLTQYFRFGNSGTDTMTVDVAGNCAIRAINNGPINLYGKVIFDLSEGAKIELDAEFINRANGSIEFTGSGTVEVKTGTALTGDVTVGSGITIVFKEIPLQTVKSLTIENGAKVVLPRNDSGTYQLIPILGSTLTAEDGVVFYVEDKSGVRTEFDCETSSNGMIFVKDQILVWNVATGNWSTSASDTPWSGSAFTNGKGVYFGDVNETDEATVTVVESPAATFGAFGNGNTSYVFEGASDASMAIFNTINLGGNATFNLPMYVDGAVHVMGGVTKFTSEQDGIQALNTKGVVVYDGATFGAKSMKRELNRIKYIRIYFKSARDNNGYIRFDEFSFTTNGKTGLSGIARIYGNPEVGSYENLGRMCDGKHNTNNSRDTNYFVGITAASAAMLARNVYVTIELANPVPMFDRYGIYATWYDKGTSITSDSFPGTWDIEVSLDGISWVPVSSAGYRDTPASSGGWYGSNQSYYSVDVSAVTDSSVEVNAGGTLLAEGALETALTFKNGSIIKAVEGKAIDFGKLKSVEYPEEPVKIDVSDLTLSSTPQTIIANANYQFKDLYHFELLEDHATLRINANGDLVVIASDGLHGPYQRTLGEVENWNTSNWYHYLGQDDEETGLPLTAKFSKSWNDAVLDWATDVRVDFAEGTRSSVLTIDCDVKFDTFGALTTNTVRGVDFTIKANEGKVFDAQTLDFSAFTGTTTFEPNCGTAHVIAGPQTRLLGGGSGLLTVSSDATVVLTKPWQGTIEGKGTIILDPGEGNEWTDLSILGCNTTSTIVLNNGSMKITEGTSVTVNRVVCADGAKFINSPTSGSWVFNGKNVEIQSGGELVFEITDSNWGEKVDFTRVSGNGSIVYENKTGSALTTLGKKIPGTMTVVMRDGVYNLVSPSELEVAVNAARIVVSEGAEFSADSVGNTDGQYKYLRVKFFDTGKTIKVLELGVKRGGAFQNITGATVTADDSSGCSGLGYLVDGTNIDFEWLVLPWANPQFATFPGTVTLNIELKSPLPMFDCYSFGIGEKKYNPTAWDMEVSEDGVNYVLVSSIRNASPGQWGWMGGGNSGAFRASKPADLTITAGGALLAKGNLETIVKFEDGAIIKPVADQTMALVGNSGLILPETGQVMIDVSEVDSAEVGESIKLITGAKFTEDDLAKLKITGKGRGYRLILGADGSLQLTRSRLVSKIIIK